MDNYTFPCGCTFPVVGEDELGQKRIKFVPNFQNLNYFCPKTWDMISSGNTKGVFQVESFLGQKLSKEVKPQSIEELSDLIAIMRPGCMQSKLSDGKSLTKHYTMRKHGQEPVVYFHNILQDALESTYAILVYQEQAMQIARDVAKFSMVEADTLRAAIGKKKADEMAKIKILFLKKAEEAGIVSVKEAEEIFGWIEASQRYSFNKCLGVNTLVETEDGKHITLLELKEGTYIKAPAAPKPPQSLAFEYVKVLKKYENGFKDVYRVDFHGGFSIKCTLMHKFMTQGGYTKTAKALFKDKYCKVLCDDGLYHSIDRIEFIGREKTMDLEVDSDMHIFYANGIATSNSHSVSYSYDGYLSAYCKAHFPKAFFASWLKYSKDKQDPLQERKELINNAKSMFINVKVPSFSNKIINRGFKIIKNDIYFGFNDIKDIGDANFKKMVAKIEEVTKEIGKPHYEWEWIDYLVNFAPYINIAVNKALISTGCLDYMNISRNRMLYELEKYVGLNNDREFEWCKKNKKPVLLDMIEDLSKQSTGKNGAMSNKNRQKKVKDLVEIIKNPPYNLTDGPEWIAAVEESYLGVALTCSPVDAKNKESANCTCLEFDKELKCLKVYMIAAKLDAVKETTIKNGKSAGSKMAFLELSDSSGVLNSVVCFNEPYKKFQNLLHPGNTVIICGSKGKEGSLVVNKVFQI